MSQAEFAVNFFVALFALIDPIGNVPLFEAATAGAKARDRAWIALYISVFIFFFLSLFYFTGLIIVIIALTINFIGDGLRDAFDPTQTRVRA